ncbi:MAG: hypothetical protein KatS3mg104_2237 [Phycisphaerae bacterium]|nr:MAG: hypothetical protein KatS3mg104_2237 [Phycisphaerae bacterium]
MKVSPEVSELDYNNTTSISGQAIPGLRTRKVQSIVEMSEGQTLALAGLLQRRVDSRNQSTPLLGDLPIIGAMFRNVSYQRSETELVILVTPRLAQAMNPDQVPPTPGQNWKYPNEAELFGMGDLGGPRSVSKTQEDTVVATPRFVGPHGFDETASNDVQPTIATTDNRE